MKKALVFGASGQAGRYLVSQLRSQGFYVIGTFKDHSFRAEETLQPVFLDLSDYTDSRDIINAVIAEEQPDEIYNLASIMFAPDSWKDPSKVTIVNGLCVTTILDAIYHFSPSSKFVQAGSSDGIEAISPYGLAKQFASNAVALYRDLKGLHASTAVFYNMESPYRSDFFFSQKVVKSVVAGKFPFKIGSLAAVRDWGWTEEYMEAMQRMARAKEPKDYVIATGKSHSCREFVLQALQCVGVDLTYPFTHYCVSDHSDDAFQTRMLADPSQIFYDLGWKATIKFRDVVRLLVKAEQARVQNENTIAR